MRSRPNSVLPVKKSELIIGTALPGTASLASSAIWGAPRLCITLAGPELPQQAATRDAGKQVVIAIAFGLKINHSGTARNTTVVIIRVLFADPGVGP